MLRLRGGTVGKAIFPMAACESPLPENIESLSPWKQMNRPKPSSFGDIFREPPPPLFHRPPRIPEPPSSSSLLTSVVGSADEMEADAGNCTEEEEEEEEEGNGAQSSFLKGLVVPAACSHRKTESFSSMNSESLQLCTEGLGFESFDDVEDLRVEVNESSGCRGGGHGGSEEEDGGRVAGESTRQYYLPQGRMRTRREFRRSRSVGSGFPPPISSISVSGKPWVCFKSYRHDGRFVLKEIRIPTQEVLHASREDGRLRMHFVHRSDEVEEEEDKAEEEEPELEQEKNEEEEEGLVELEEEERNGNGGGH